MNLSNTKTNGRVNLIDYPKTSTLFKLYDKNPINSSSSPYQNATEGIWTDTILSKTFFSKENIIIIQNAIRKNVYDLSKNQYLISNQSIDDIKIIMRAIFLQNARNNGNIQSQIIELNNMVIKTCVDIVIKEVEGYLNYIKDISTLVVPMDRPILHNRLDGRNNEFKGWF